MWCVRMRACHARLLAPGIRPDAAYIPARTRRFEYSMEEVLLIGCTSEIYGDVYRSVHVPLGVMEVGGGAGWVS